MKYLILALTSGLATIGAALLTMLGMDYLDPNIGQGLHPGIAFPLATLMICAVIALALMLTSIEDDPYDYEEQENAVIALSEDGIYLKR